MTSVTVERRTGLKSASAIKAPCRAVASSNISLNGEQTIDGVAIVDGDRVLVRGQTDARNNGILIASTGNWQRSPDFRDNNDITKGTQVYVTDGTSSGGRWFGLTTENPVSIGTSSIVFSLSDNNVAAEAFRDAAQAWAINPEDTPVPISAGGDGATTFSAKHWAAKSAAFSPASRAIRVSDYATPALAAAAAFALNAIMIVEADESVPLICNPTTGDDLEAMAAWISAGHMVERGGELYLQIDDGKHYVKTQVSVFDGRVLDIRASAAPDQRTITGITIANVSGTTYDATITVSSALPAQAVVGSVVGLYDVQGDGCAGAVNGGHVIRSIAGNTFVVRIQVTGVTPTNVTSLTTTLTPAIGGMGTNLAIFPKCTIQADQDGWDGGGAPYEAFMEARNGGKIALKYVGIAYDNTTTGADPNSDDDIFFAFGAGSIISMVDQCVIAGTGEMMTRSFNFGHIHAYRSCLGGGATGVNFWQGSGGGTALFQRSMLGSVSGIGMSASAASHAYVDKCIMAGANQIARPTYATASLTITQSRLVFGNYGMTLSEGIVRIDAASRLDRCTYPMSMVGGELYGNPIVSNCTNAVPTGDTWDANGGAWHKSGTELSSTKFNVIGTATAALDFPSISAGSYQDLTITVAGATVGMGVILARTATWPAQAVLYTAFVSAADTVTVRAYNISGGSIDPTNATWKVTVVST